MAKFNWGRALMAAGQGLGDYASQKRREQEIADERAYREQQAELQHSRLLERMQFGYDMRNPLMPMPQDIQQEFPEFGQQVQYPNSFAPGDVMGPQMEQSAPMVRQNTLLSLMGQMPEEPEPVVQWGTPKSYTDEAGKVVTYQVDPQTGEYKVLSQSAPKASGSGGGSPVAELKRRHGVFEEMLGGQKPVTSNRSIPIKDEDGNTIGYDHDVSTTMTDVPGSVFDATGEYGPRAFNIPGLALASADSLARIPEYSGLSDSEIVNMALDIHRPRGENLATEDRQIGAVLDAISAPGVGVGVSDDGDWTVPDDGWFSWGPHRVGPTRKELTDQEFAAWLSERKDSLGVGREELRTFLTEQLGISNPWSYLGGNDPVFKEDVPESAEDMLEQMLKRVSGEQ